jgi:hypothetical protein
LQESHLDWSLEPLQAFQLEVPQWHQVQPIQRPVEALEAFQGLVVLRMLEWVLQLPGKLY